MPELITDHKFEEKPWAAAAWETYGSELAGDIAYCNICNKPSWEHESSGANQLKKALDEARIKARCAQGHSFFLRSADYRPVGVRRSEGIYEYECNLCSIPNFFTDEEKRPFPKHPLCVAGEHYWTIPCSCCYPGELHCGRLCGEVLKITPEMRGKTILEGKVTDEDYDFSKESS